MDKKYYLIEFYAEGETETKPAEVVPKIWVDEHQKFVYWPPRTGAAFKALVRKAEKLPTESWTIQRYNRILGRYGSYSEALAKLRKSEDTSNLESEVEEPGLSVGSKRRSRGHKRTHSSSEEDSDSSVSINQFSLPAQKLPSFYLSLAAANSSQITPAPNIAHTRITDISQDAISLPEVEAIVETDRPGTSATAKENATNCYKAAVRTQGLSDLSLFQVESYECTPEGQNLGAGVGVPASSATDISLTGISVATSEDVASVKTFMAEFAEKTFRLLLGLSQEVKEIKALIETTRPEGGRTKLDFSKIPTLPLVDRSNLSELESWIALEANFNLLRAYLGLIGGSSTEKITRNILKKLISSVLRKDANFTGKGGKVEFQKLKLFQCIKDAVRINKDDSKDDEIQKATIEWLRNTKKNV